MKDPKLPGLLHIPPSLLTKALYAWLPIVALWSWPPVISGVLLAFLALCLTLLRIQQNLWRNCVKANALGSGAFVYEERLRVPLRPLLLNLLVVLGISGLLGYWMRARLTLSGLQWALLALGLLYTEQFLLWVWTPDYYLVTEGGIWVLTGARHIFAGYRSIAEVQVAHAYTLPQRATYTLIPIKVPTAVFLTSVEKTGFACFARDLLLLPQDEDRLLALFPSHLIVAAPSPN